MTRTLYDLAGAEEDRRFSPYCWRTKLALAHKGLAFETIPWRFTEKDRIAFSGQGMVPVLVDGERSVSDSWAIAEYLEATYPDRPSLFGGPAAQALARFVNSWTDGILHPWIGRMVVRDILDCILPEDRAYFRESRERRFGTTLEALAATRAELAATARHAGVLEERQRLAREIHDTVAHSLTSVVTQLEAADQAIDERPGDARRHLDIARRSARDGLTDIRRSVRELRPDLLEGASFGEALERACRRWSTETGILARLRTTGTAIPLHPDTETALLRTVQEALVNTAKHASATRVTVTLSYLGDAVSLDIDDDGVGFAGAPRPRADGGFGLAGMRERVAAVGGELHIESAPGSGTTIAASVPV